MFKNVVKKHDLKNKSQVTEINVSLIQSHP